MENESLFESLKGSPWLFAIVLTSLVLLLCSSAIFPRKDSQEPPSIRPTIPLIGHIIGLLRYQAHYFEMLNAKYGLPNYTLPMLTGKAYVVTSPELTQSVMRVKNDGLSVEPFLVNVVGKNLNDQSPEAMKLWSHISKDKNEPYFLQDMTKIFVKQLAFGSQLNSLNLTALTTFSNLIDIVRTPKEENLYLFLRNTFTIAATTGLFGPQNPMLIDHSLSDAQWAMEARSLWVFMGLFPKYLFPKAFAGRAAVQAAHIKYHTSGYDSVAGVSALIKSYSEMIRGYGFTNNDIGKADIGILHGVTSNAALVLFWFVVHIFADATLLEDIRAEVINITSEQQRDQTGSRQREVTIDISRAASTCPLLSAVHAEVLRLKAYSIIVRSVKSDTTVTDADGTKYLFKAGAVLQIPSAVAQTSVEIWGPDAHVFNPRRFLKSAGGKEASPEKRDGDEKAQKKAYFPFSGGIHKCPGRHFATAEHLGMVAMLALGFEITTLDGKGITIPRNPEAQRGISSGVAKPSDEFAKLQVKLERRSGWKDVTWRFKVAEEK